MAFVGPRRASVLRPAFHGSVPQPSAPRASVPALRGSVCRIATPRPNCAQCCSDRSQFGRSVALGQGAMFLHKWAAGAYCPQPGGTWAVARPVGTPSTAWTLRRGLQITEPSSIAEGSQRPDTRSMSFIGGWRRGCWFPCEGSGSRCRAPRRCSSQRRTREGNSRASHLRNTVAGGSHPRVAYCTSRTARTVEGCRRNQASSGISGYRLVRTIRSMFSTPSCRHFAILRCACQQITLWRRGSLR